MAPPMHFLMQYMHGRYIIPLNLGHNENDDIAETASDGISRLRRTLKRGGRPDECGVGVIMDPGIVRYNPVMKDEKSRELRQLSVLERERAMGFPDFYTDVASVDTDARRHMLGNSFSIPTIAHLLHAYASHAASTSDGPVEAETPVVGVVASVACGTGTSHCVAQSQPLASDSSQATASDELQSDERDDGENASQDTTVGAEQCGPRVVDVEHCPCPAVDDRILIKFRGRRTGDKDEDENGTWSEARPNASLSLRHPLLTPSTHAL